MSELRISEDLALPLDYMTMATVVYGARGSGKTNLGVVIAEELHKRGQRFCAVDLKGDWWGLKSSADGRGEGIPVVIFGGDHADLPLDDASGAAIGRAVAEVGHSAIVDLEHLSKGKQVRWLKDFFLALYHHNREPLLVIADEIQRYAPQRPMSPDETMCLAAVEDTIKLGRKHGLGILGLTQRGAGLNKEVSELCDVLMAMRTPGPIDQERIKDWLDANTTREERDTVMGLLAKLPTGTAVVASGHPALQVFKVVPIRHRETFDSSATPKVGERRIEPERLAPVDLEALRARLAEAVGRVQETDPAALKARIAELQRKLAERPHAEPERIVVEREIPILSEHDTELLASVAVRLEATARALTDMVPVLTEVAATINGELRASANERAAAAIAPHPAPSAPVPLRQPKVSGPSPAAPSAAPSTDLGDYARGLLETLARHDPLRPTRVQLATLAGRRPRSSAYGAALTELARARLIAKDGDRYRLTDAGRKAVGRVAPPPQNAAQLRARWVAALPGYEAALLEALIAAHPAALSRQALAERAGRSITSSAFGSAISTLVKNGLAESRDGALKASATLFLDAGGSQGKAAAR